MTLHRSRTVPLLLIVLFLLSACAEKKERIIIWNSMRPVERALLDSLLDSFSPRYPEYDFQQLFYAPEEARTNFIISSLAGKGPELLHSASDNIGPFVDLQVIRPLDDLFSSVFLDSFLNDPVIANTYYHGKLYQLADRVGNHLCLVYNKDLISKPPQTMNELIALKQQFAKDADGDGKPDSYVLAWNYTEPFFAIPFIGGYGGWIFDDQNQPTLDQPATVKAAQLIFDLANKYKVIPKECDYEIANALFKDGLTPMIINGPWSWGTYIDAGLDIGLARIPKIDETGLWPTPLFSPRGYVVNVNMDVKKQEAVRALLKYLTGPDVELQFTRLTGSIPSRKEAYADPRVTHNELLQKAIDQIMVGRPMPVITEMRWMWDAMRPAYQGIFTGQSSAEEAARQMQALAEKLIRENKE